MLTIRRAFGSELPNSGLSGSAAPVAGLTRISDPFRSTGLPLGRRRLWLRRAPPRADGGVIVPFTPPGGSPHGFFGVGLLVPPPSWPQSREPKLAPSPEVA